MGGDQRSKKLSTPTPIRELKRFGLRRAFLTKANFVVAVLGVLCAFIVPRGQGDHLSALLNTHSVLAGFGFTVFGFVILGGKDEFFIPILKKKKLKALESLQNMVLHLFWPFAIQLALIILCIFRMLLLTVELPSYVYYGWRVIYAVLALYGFLQLYYGVRFLFGLAIGRLQQQYRVAVDPDGNKNMPCDTQKGGSAPEGDSRDG